MAHCVVKSRLRIRCAMPFLRGRWKGRLRESVPWERNDDWWCLGGLALHCIQPVAHCGEITSVTVSRGFVLHCRTLCVGQRVAKLDRLISLSARYTYTIHLSTESLSKGVLHISSCDKQCTNSGHWDLTVLAGPQHKTQRKPRPEKI